MRIALAGVLLALGLVGCDDVRPTVSLDGGIGGGGGGGGSAGHDECHVDSDCHPIECLVAPCPDVVCVLGSDGLHHCGTRSRPQLATCNSTTDGCCTDSACTDAAHGICAPSDVVVCSGGPPLSGDRCVYDQCESDADCTAHAHGFCSGDLPRACIYGPCTTSADCTKHAGGICALEIVGGYCPGPAVFCSYPDDPCHINTDCGSGFTMACLPNSDGQGESCQQVSPPPP